MQRVVTKYFRVRAEFDIKHDDCGEVLSALYVPCSCVATAAAESLNNTIIGGKKRNYYHDDIWNLKYLRKFKWDHLTEKVAYERRVRAQKLRLETMQAKR